MSVEDLSFESIFSPRKSLVTKRGPFVNFVWIIKAMLAIQFKTTNRIRTWLLQKPRIQLQVFFFPTSEIDSVCFFLLAETFRDMVCGLSVVFRLVNDLQDKNLSIFITALQELFEVCVSSLKVFLPFTALPTTSFELPIFFLCAGPAPPRTSAQIVRVSRPLIADVMLW